MSDNRVGILIGAIVGSILVAALGLFLAAWLLRHPPVEGLLANGMADGSAPFTNESEIYEQAAKGGSNPMNI